jgi:hypothetical protein
MRESRTYGSGRGREVTRVPTAKLALHCILLHLLTAAYGTKLKVLFCSTLRPLSDQLRT